MLGLLTVSEDPGGVLQGKLGGGCAARFPKPLPFFDQNLQLFMAEQILPAL